MVDFSHSEEHRALIDTAKRFARERIIPVAGECDRESKFPMDVFKAAWEIGLVNPGVPEEYGGAGMGELENALITEQMAYGCTGIQTSITANQMASRRSSWAAPRPKKKYSACLTSDRLWRATPQASPTPAATSPA